MQPEHRIVVEVVPLAAGEALSHDRAYAAVRGRRRGAVVLFLGTVRDYHGDREVLGITYQTHPTLTHSAIREICAQVLGDEPDCAAYVAHAEGYVQAGAASVVVAVSTAHRREAFAACQQIMDLLKVHVPLWKQEHFGDGSCAWSEGNIVEPLSRNQLRQ